MTEYKLKSDWIDEEELPSNGQEDKKGHSTLFVSNLPDGIQETALKNLFAKYGNIKRIFMKIGANKQPYLICHYGTVAEAQAAIDATHRTPPMNLIVKMAVNKPRDPLLVNHNEKDYNENRFNRNRFNGNKSFDNENGINSGHHKKNNLFEKLNGTDNSHSTGRRRLFEIGDDKTFSPVQQSSPNTKNNSISLKSNISTGTGEAGNKYLSKYISGNLKDSTEVCVVDNDQQYMITVKKFFEQIKNLNKCTCRNNDSNSMLGNFWEQCRIQEAPIIFKLQKANCSTCKENLFSANLYSFSHLSTSGCDCPNVNCKKESAPLQSNSRSQVDRPNSKYTERFSAQGGSIGNQVFINVVRRVGMKTKWLCCAADINTKDKYDLLCNEFIKDCNSSKHDGSKIDMDALVAVNMKDNSGWFRAVYISDASWALIDDGRIVKECNVISVIPCPKEYENIPAFTCVLNVNPGITIKVGTELRCEVLCKNLKKNISVVAWDNGEGDKLKTVSTIEAWKPIDNVKQSSPKDKISKTTETPVEPIQMKPVLLKVKFNNGDLVTIVNFINTGEIYIRLADKKTTKAYYNTLTAAEEFGRKGTRLTKPPNSDDIVYCRLGENGKYHRALVKSYNDSANTCDVIFLDIGLSSTVKFTSLREYDRATDGIQLFISKVSLAAIENHSINSNISIYAEDLMDKQTKFICTYSGPSHRSPSGVYLNEETTNIEINKKIKEMLVPAFERIKKDDINVTDLPPILEEDIPLVDLNVNKSKGLFPVIVLNTDSIIDYTLMCTVADEKIMEKFGQLMAEINKYCNTQDQHYVPRVGECCLALFDDDNWYRAIVLEINVENIQATVFFMDYGNISKVSALLIRKILPEFTNIPQMARLCKLEGLNKKCTRVCKSIIEMVEHNKGLISVEFVKEVSNDIHIRVPSIMTKLKDEGLI